MDVGTRREIRKLLRALMVLTIILDAAYEDGALTDEEPRPDTFVQGLFPFRRQPATVICKLEERVRSMLCRALSVQRTWQFPTHSGRHSTLVATIRFQLLSNQKLSHLSSDRYLRTALQWIEQRANGMR